MVCLGSRTCKRLRATCVLLPVDAFDLSKTAGYIKGMYETTTNYLLTNDAPTMSSPNAGCGIPKGGACRSLLDLTKFHQTPFLYTPKQL